ncbi:DoxX family membrane protein [Altererythrobacter sp. ZODW24]|uniref:DoxX family membrane protein n=1 Tax=Altererythrobacter sp. ZODW24 TaxID=2185142 RepID=UPI000DF7A1A8|nr:DoxX family membrane protein [Altererythrobacter sp. ZODW24]
MTDEKRLKIGLLALRVGIATVFLVWTIDKIVNYAHNSKMIEHYYHVEISQPILLILGLAELVFVAAFTLGLFKTLTYGGILLFHAITTLASSPRLFPPYEIHQLLYFGSIPMLAACVCLFLCRDSDTLLTARPAVRGS